MLVCNDNNEVVGVVTRKDLARFRVVHHGSRMARYFSIWKLKHINHHSPLNLQGGGASHGTSPSVNRL